MSLFPAPLTAILNAIATQNSGVTLDPSQYSFGTPTPYATSNQNINTSMLITVTDTVDSPYQGSVTVYYKRLNLSDLSVLLFKPIRGNGWTTVADFWAVLNANYGLNFVTGDLNDSDTLTIAEDGTGTVTLTAQANSIGWIGSVTLPFALGNYDLATVTTTTQLVGLNYPNQNITTPFGEMYSYWRDFTQWQSDFQNTPVSSTTFTTIAADMVACTGDAWSASASGRYSLLGSTIVYNGTVKNFTNIAGTEMTPNPAYMYVMVIQLGAGSLGYGGYLFLHYGAIDQFTNVDGTPDYTSLLLHFDGINGSSLFYDNTGKVISASNAIISTAESLYGGSSYFWNNNTAAYIETVDVPALEFPASQDGTIEGFFYPTSGTQDGILFSKNTAGTQLEYNAGNLVFSTDQTTSMFNVASGFTLNAWNHVALVKASGVWTLYVQGLPIATNSTATSDTFGVNASAFMIGNNAGLANAFEGYIEEFRVSNIARYTGQFTVPTYAFVVD